MVNRVLMDGMMSAGSHEVVWNTRNIDGTTAASGVYLFKIIADEILLQVK